MELLSRFTCCGKRTEPSFKQKERLEIENNQALQFYKKFERFKGLQGVKADQIVHDIKLLATSENTIKSRTLSQIYERYGINFTELMPVYS